MTWRSNPETPAIRNITAQGEFVRAAGGVEEDWAAWTDEALMAAIVAQESRAFAALYDRYSDLVYATTLRVLADAQLAEDATQDVFVRLWRRPQTFIAERGRFISWLMSVSRNRAVDELRSRGRRRRREGPGLEAPEDQACMLIPDDREDPQHSAEVREEQAVVRRALKDLPQDQRRALELAYFGGLTQVEISVSLHEPLGTIKTRIRLGMQKLRRALEDQR
jgi:RNA polymerase sigma-70 factor (ECF subfamily)